MSSTLQSALASLQQNDYVSRMHILFHGRSSSQPYHSGCCYCCRIWLWWAIGSVPIRSWCTNFHICQSLHFRMRYDITYSAPLCTSFASLITCVDRIHLGQQTLVWQGDEFLIEPQSKPWTRVSTLFIIVCIELLQVVATRNLLALI